MRIRRYTATAGAIALSVAMGALLELGLDTEGAHAADNVSGTLGAQTVLQSGCVVSGAAAAGNTGVNLGTLDFGSHPSTFIGVITATPSGGAGGTGATQITCSPDITAPNVMVSAGNNPGQGSDIGTGSRALKFGNSYLPYEVYSDSAMTTPYPTGATALGTSLPGTGAPVGLPVFGRINKTTGNAIAPGTYSDVLQVTLSW